MLAERRAFKRPVPAPMLRRRLVGDDAMIRDNSAELLAARGHQAAQASSGKAAADLLEGERFDVLMTDPGRPGIDGLSLARLALERQPLIGLVFATGEDILGGAMPDGLARPMLLRKPYDEAGLLAAVRARLGRQAADRSTGSRSYRAASALRSCRQGYRR